MGQIKCFVIAFGASPAPQISCKTLDMVSQSYEQTVMLCKLRSIGPSNGYRMVKYRFVDYLGESMMQILPYVGIWERQGDCFVRSRAKSTVSN